MKTFFVHIPKTAGISFRDNLQRFYNSSRSLHIYLPKNLKDKNINDYDLVTGHITPLKSDISENRIIVTWIRNPVDRLMSQFFYQKYYQETNSDSLTRYSGYPKEIDNFLHEFLKYALDEENRNMIYVDYFTEINIFDYNFIGITENFSKDQFTFFKTFFNSEVSEVYFTNYNSMINKDKNNSYFIDKGVRNEIERFHDKDMDLYHSILDLREVNLL